MKLGTAACLLVVGISAAAGCGTEREFGTAIGGADGKGGNASAGSGHSGAAGMAGADIELDAGASGMGGVDTSAGASGMAGFTDEPVGLCVGKVCDTPPASACKDANTRTTYTSNGTCSAGNCNYAASETACAGDTPKCKSLPSASQCVTCLADADCSNGGTCSSNNTCVCSARFNGKRCEFQVFRGLKTLLGDWYSREPKISRDGSVVVGLSLPMNGSSQHVFRSVNGGALQFIANPASSTGNCAPVGIDSSGNVLLSCGSGQFVYSPGGVATPIETPSSGSFLDMSLDGKVLVGRAASQAVHRAGSASTLLGPLLPDGSSWFTATNGDGSVAVGKHAASGYSAAIRWTASTGLVALPLLSTWFNPAATDVSTDGKVIVGFASLESEILYGQIAVKWSGAPLVPTLLGGGPVFGSAAAVNFDGSVIVGSQSTPSVAMLWDSTGGHSVKSLLGSTPDLTSDWTLESASGVSDDGKFVVGVGTHGSTSEVWVAHLP